MYHTLSSLESHFRPDSYLVGNGTFQGQTLNPRADTALTNSLANSMFNPPVAATIPAPNVPVEVKQMSTPVSRFVSDPAMIRASRQSGLLSDLGVPKWLVAVGVSIPIMLLLNLILSIICLFKKSRW